MRAEWTTTRHDGVTLVSGVLSNDGPARRVRVTNALDGPVWPPRRRGVPEPGWDDDGTTVTVPENGTRAVGYATPAAPTDDGHPATIELGDRVRDDPAFDRHPDVPALHGTPDGVVAALSDPRPSRAAVPPSVPTEARVPGESETGQRDVASPRGDESVRGTVANDADSAAESGAASTDRSPTTADSSAEAPGPDPPVERPAGATPPKDRSLGGTGVDLSAIERRVERAEALATAGTLPEATRAVEAVDGLDGVRSLPEQLMADARALRSLEAEVAALRERCERGSVPVERLEALA